MPGKEDTHSRSGGTDNGSQNGLAPTSSIRTTRATESLQNVGPVASAPTALLSPRAVPVWAAQEIERHEQQSDDGTVISNRPSNISMTSSSGRTHVTSAHQPQIPPSPILATTNTTWPEGGSSQSRWKDFALRSQIPHQSRIEDELLNESTTTRGKVTRTGASLPSPSAEDNDLRAANQRQINNVSRSGKLSGSQKRSIIPISDLEKQMDLNGPWNPARDHKPTGAVSELVSRTDAALSVPTAAAKDRSNYNLPNYSSNGLSQFQMTSEIAEKRRRERWKINLKAMLLDNPYVPMTLRSGIFVLSILALAMAASVFVHTSDHTPEPLSQQPSTIMAICVQSIAMVYLVYITYDEYSGKPLGLRNAKDKVKLIMLDLLFIIFSSANLALSFNTLYDKQWLCQSPSGTGMTDSTPYDGGICRRQRGLVSFLFVVLLMWVMTFTISIFRVVERVSGGGNEV
ncbi:hypothetical protein V1525DRAFT_398478 [Lipomyces kononenkoae]|uniref:Uncharacterized protein n=1 Tax=Lipomyces kononenkoae TaxID=34357 RepID=A0ACC3T6T0_LIPKO